MAQILNSPPNDLTSKVEFGLNQKVILGVTSWDCSFRLYDPIKNNIIKTCLFKKPLLDFSFNENASVAYISSVEGELTSIDIEKVFSEELIGSHKLAISCVKYDQTNGVVVTGSWDTYVNIWDPRSQNRLVTQFSHNLKIYSMDLCGPNKFIVATDNQKVMLWDVRKNTEPIFTRNNNLKCIGGSISALPDGSGYAISSYEGRISINYVEDSLNKTNGFNFKCHRVSDSSTDIIYPVTFLKFLQYKNSRPYLMSAGGDGKVLCWNVKERRRIFNSTRYTSSISSVCVTHEPALIATAVGNLLPVGSDGLYTNEFDYNVCSKEKYWINVQPFDIKSVYKGLQN